MYFEDLTSYSYSTRGRRVEQVRNIGWLEERSSFPTGDLDSRVCQLLQEHYVALVANQMRGVHACSLCTSNVPEPTIQLEGKSYFLGAAELWIPDDEGRIFATPDLVIHYILRHAYRPPDEFVAAVLMLPTTIVGWNGDAMAEKLCWG